MVIEPLDAADPDALAAWHDCYYASSTFGREVSTPYMLEELRAQFLTDSHGEKTFALTGREDGTVVAVGSVALPTRDNLQMAWVELHTRPEHRNRGHGSAMLEALSELARLHGRRTLTAEASFPYDCPPDGAGHPHSDFLTHRGFDFGLGDVMRVLDLPADETLLQRLVDEAAPHHTEYRIRQFLGPVPDDIIDSFGELVGSLMTDAPVGELELDPEVIDATRIRANEQVLEDSGRSRYTTVGIAPDGTVAAYSELVVPRHHAGRVYQWGTLAHRNHRGHRLGMATKTRNLSWFQQENPDAELLVTYNAEVNSHMIGVNEAMGFRPVERLGEFQK
ncbi:MAG TPA: GNAT family N-acetyltransferase, partial [Nocardioidaceae bacterium]|nr:GNAT family N-acetyltransferase [Nocardioidaceae bacterium]